MTDVHSAASDDGVIRGKFPDASLWAKVSEGAEGSANVLVELAVPRQGLARHRDHGAGQSRFAFAEHAAEEDVTAPAEALGRLISEISGTPPTTYLRAARAFVVTAPISGLGKLAESGLVKTIRPNRKLTA